MRLLLCLLFGLIAVTPLAGCERINRDCQSVGLCELPDGLPVAVEVLLDNAQGTPFNRASANATFQAVLHHVSSLPGSVVRIWVMGPDVSSVSELATIAVPRLPQTGARAKRARLDRFIETHTTDLMRRVEPLLEGPRSRRSPLLETLTRIAITPSPQGLPRTILILGRAQEVSGFADFQCSNVPQVQRFLPRLRRAGVLPHASLSGQSVVFSYVNLGPIEGRPGCRMTLAREAQIETFWRAVLTQSAGAADVRFERGVVVFNQPSARETRVAQR